MHHSLNFVYMKGQKLKIGIFGVGHLGRIHVRLLMQMSEKFEVIGFYDPAYDSAAKTIAEFGIKQWEDPDALIASSDCIDIVTPTVSHFEIAVKAIRQSKHVFIEKPITETPEQAKILLDLSEEAGVIVQVGHVERYNPAFIAAQAVIQNPMFFEIHRLAKYNPRGTDVSVVLDLMIHDIDIVLSSVNSNVKRISASGVSVVSKTPDITSVRIEFDNGCVANLTASRMSLANMRKTRIFQQSGYIVIDFLNQSVEHIRITSKSEIINDNDHMALNDEVSFSPSSLEIENTNAISEEFHSFYGSITGNKPVVVSVHDAYRALDIACQILDKLKYASVGMVE